MNLKKYNTISYNNSDSYLFKNLIKLLHFNLQERNKTFNIEFFNLLNYKYSSIVKFKIKGKINNYRKGKLLLNNEKLIIIRLNPEIHFKNNKINLSSKENILCKPLLSLNFNQISTKFIFDMKTKEIIFYILGNSDKNEQYTIIELKLDSLNNNQFENFIKILYKIINLSIGSSTNLLNISLYKNFYENYYISYSEFLYQCKTCDILLFRGFSGCSKFQRFFTRAVYDHIALIIKYNQKIFIYESTSFEGVKLKSFHDYFDYSWYLLYDKITYRPLLINNDILNPEKINKEFEEKIKEFIKKTHDKKYSLKGLCLKSNENRFFCSELISSAYRYLDILSNKTINNTYLPGAFSKEGHIKFNDGFQLGPEYIIYFNE